MKAQLFLFLVVLALVLNEVVLVVRIRETLLSSTSTGETPEYEYEQQE